MPGGFGFGLGSGPADVVLRPDAAELRGIRRHARPGPRHLAAGRRRRRWRRSSPASRARRWCWPGQCWSAWPPRTPGCAATFATARSCCTAAEEAPSVIRIASAVADGLLAAGLIRRGADSVEVVVDPRASTAACSATSTRSRPRSSRPRSTRRSRRSGCRATCCRAGCGPSGPHGRSPGGAVGCGPGFGRISSDGVVWHAVPTVLGVNAERAAAYAKAWDHWVGGGDARLHRLARGPGHPGRPAGHRPVRGEHGDAAAVGLMPGAPVRATTTRSSSWSARS